MIRWITVWAIMLIALPCVSMLGQPGVAIGVWGHMGFTAHRADFGTLPGIPGCCPAYTQGSGRGPTLGALVSLPIASDLTLLLRASWVDHGGELTASEPFMAAVDGVAVPGRVDHLLTLRASSIALETTVGLHVWRGLRLHAGFSAGVPVRGSFDQREVLVEPVGIGTFENGSRTRNIISDAGIPDMAGIGLALLVAAEYALPMNARGSLWLVPELVYARALTPMVSGLALHADAVRVGVSLRFVLPSSPGPQRSEPQPAGPDTEQ